MPPEGDYEIREYRPGDEASILRCFNHVFGELDPEGFRPRTLAEWQWAFRDNPAGIRVWLGLYGGEVVSQYAALPYRVWIGGEERVFAQIVDSMVHPDHRAGLKRPGLFVRTAWPFFDHYGGPDRDLVHYGWPVERAWKVGRQFLKYEIVRTQPFLVREVSPDAPTPPPAGVEVLGGFDEQARWLYDRCVGRWAASTIRDAAFLDWRFTRNPHHDYTSLGVRDAEGVLRGYAVLRKADWFVPDMGLICDWLVPEDEPAVADALLAACDASAREQGCRVLATIFPDWSSWFARFQDQGFLVHPTDYFMVGRNFARRHHMKWLRENWWYQLADTDLV